MFSLMCARINGWVNNREAGDLRRHRAHYDVSVMLPLFTHWDRVTHICVSKLITIVADDGLLPSRHQAIICTNDGILLIRILGTNSNEILSEILTYPFKKMHLKISSAKWWTFCLGLDVLIQGPHSCMSPPSHIAILTYRHRRSLSITRIDISVMSRPSYQVT